MYTHFRVDFRVNTNRYPQVRSGTVSFPPFIDHPYACFIVAVPDRPQADNSVKLGRIRTFEQLTRKWRRSSNGWSTPPSGAQVSSKVWKFGSLDVTKTLRTVAGQIMMPW